MTPDQRDFARQLDELKHNPDTTAAWLAGVAMSREDAISYALSEADRAALAAD